MRHTATTWDYLIVTASNDLQSRAYERQLQVRRELGMLSEVGEVLVVPDPGGKRIGSGGSTIACLMEVLGRELPAGDRGDPSRWLAVLRRVRVLIVHAGGDSRRLPAYGPCGKIFIPVPGTSDPDYIGIGPTLFDRQLPTYLALPEMPDGAGQVVITAGDVLLRFDPSDVRFAPAGITGLACFGAPKQASKHGVFCGDAAGRVRRYLQKPSPAEQARCGAVDRYGRSAMDIGVINFDAKVACALLGLCGVRADDDGKLAWSGAIGAVVESKGLDIYREICCALGDATTAEDYATDATASGSTLTDDELDRIFRAIHPIPLFSQVLPQCEFLHFGTTRQIIAGGADLLRQDRGISAPKTCLVINTEIADGGQITGAESWVEGCRVRSALSLGGRNVVVGVEVDQPLHLPAGACLDVLPGRDRDGGPVFFIRCYGVGDTFKDPVDGGAKLCGIPLAGWLAATRADPDDVWDPGAGPAERTLWNARVFLAEAGAGDYRKWLWMYDPSGATHEQRDRWRSGDRYSLAQMADLTDLDAFARMRDRIAAAEISQSMRRLFRNDSGFSAAELTYVLARAEDPSAVATQLLAEARWHAGREDAPSSVEAFVLSRIVHTLGSAVAGLATDTAAPLDDVLPGLGQALAPEDLKWCETVGLSPGAGTTVEQWSARAREMAFEHLHRTIVSGAPETPRRPAAALRTDEIVWGRAPARLDLAGGWTDTPPYALEHGGQVINAAVDLNGQPPIHCYARVIDRPVFRIGSIDLGMQVEISELDELLDFRSPDSDFALVKAALALCGFDPDSGVWPAGTSLAEMLEQFGGGIELTTLAAIPKGSGLGTSSIVGAVILAVVQRVMGQTLTQQQLFYAVLRLEQALTTGGGWQDQVGGVVDGVKLVTTDAGLVPEARVHYVPPDALDPHANGGCTLLYYTGITRLAKNILEQVVGRYLDRNRATMATLRRIHALAPRVAEAMARKDVAALGECIDAAWHLNKQLDPGSSNEQVEDLLARVAPHVHGAKLLGAGGGGFLLMVCKSTEDAAAVRTMLESDPPNPRARFFDFSISREGLVVTVC